MDKYGLCELLQLQSAITDYVRQRTLYADTKYDVDYARRIVDAWDAVYPALRELAYPVKVKGLREAARDGECYGDEAGR